MTERKKRTTIKDAFEQGREEGKREFEELVFETMNTVLEEYYEIMSQYPRNTKFVEIEVDAIKELREKILYNKDHDDNKKREGKDVGKYQRIRF